MINCYKKSFFIEKYNVISFSIYIKNLSKQTIISMNTMNRKYIISNEYLQNIISTN